MVMRDRGKERYSRKVCELLGVIDEETLEYNVVPVRRFLQRDELWKKVKGVTFEALNRQKMMTEYNVYVRDPDHNRLPVIEGLEVSNPGDFIVGRVKDKATVVGFLVFTMENQYVFVGKEEAYSYFSNRKPINGYLKATGLASYAGGFLDIDIEKLQGETTGAIDRLLKVFEVAGCKIGKSGNRAMVQVPKKGVMMDELVIPEGQGGMEFLEITGGDLNVRKIRLSSNSLAVAIKTKGRVLELVLEGNDGRHEKSRLMLRQLVDKIVVDRGVVQLRNVSVVGAIGNITIPEYVRRVAGSFNGTDIKAVDLQGVKEGFEVRDSFNIGVAGFETHVRMGKTTTVVRSFDRKSGVILHGGFSDNAEFISGFNHVVKTPILDLSNLSNVLDIENAFNELDDTEKVLFPESGGRLCIQDSFKKLPKVNEIHTPKNRNKIIDIFGSESFSGLKRVVSHGSKFTVSLGNVGDVEVFVKNYEGEGSLANVLLDEVVGRNSKVNLIIEEGIKRLLYHSAKELFKQQFGTKIAYYRLFADTVKVPEGLEELIPTEEESNFYAFKWDAFYNTNIKVLPKNWVAGVGFNGENILLPKNVRELEEGSLRGKRLEGVYLPESIEKIGARVFNAQVIYLKEGSTPDKVYKGSIPKVYVDSLDQIHTVDGVKMEESRTSLVKLAGVLDTEEMREAGIREDTNNLESVLHMYYEMNKEAEPKEFNIGLDTSMYKPVELTSIGVLGEYLMKECQSAEIRYYGDQEFTGTSDAFNIKSNIITGNTIGNRMGEVIDPSKWSFESAGEVESWVRSVMKKAELGISYRWYVDGKSAILAIPFKKTTFKNYINDLAVFIIVDGKVQYATLIRYNSLWQGMFKDTGAYGLERGIGRFITTGDRVDGILRTASLVFMPTGAFSAGRPKNVTGKKGINFQIAPTIFTVGEDKVVCLNSGRLIQLQKSKKELVVIEVKKDKEFGYQGLIDPEVSESARAFKVVDDLKKPYKENYKIMRVIPGPLWGLYKKNLPREEVARYVLEVLPHKVKAYPKKENMKGNINKETDRFGEYVLLNYRDYETVDYAPTFNNRGYEKYTTIEELNKNKKTVKAIVPYFSMEEALAFNSGKENIQMDELYRNRSWTRSTMYVDDQGVARHAAGTVDVENFNYSLTVDARDAYYSGNSTIERYIPFDYIDILKYGEVVKRCSPNNRESKLENLIRVYSGRQYKYYNELSKVLWILADANEFMKLKREASKRVEEWYILVKGYSEIFESGVKFNV